MYRRKIFAHLKDKELLRWVDSCDFIYIDFLENEVLSCVLWACWKGCPAVRGASSPKLQCLQPGSRAGWGLQWQHEKFGENTKGMSGKSNAFSSGKYVSVLCFC